MNKEFRVLFVIFSLFLAACKSDFHINAPSQDVYVVNCILRSDHTVQYALISKNYFSENGSAPAANTIDKNIKGAAVRIFKDDSVFVMRDTTIQETDSGSVPPTDCYYLKNLVYNPGQVIRIEAMVPDGTVLTARLQVPQISFAHFSTQFPQSVDVNYSATPYYYWAWVGSETVLNLPQLEIYYRVVEGGVWVEKKIFVPLALSYTVDDQGTLIPVKVEFTLQTYCRTTLETINKTMQEISGDDPYKKNYTITKVIFSVLGMDPLLTRYYFSRNTYAEEFTIKLRQTEISNIEGGTGVFGEYYKYSQPLVIDSLYVQSFGYQCKPM